MAAVPIQSPPLTGHQPRFASKILPPLKWTNKFLLSNRARKTPFTKWNVTQDFVPAYHHVPQPVKDVLKQQSQEQQGAESDKPISLYRWAFTIS